MGSIVESYNYVMSKADPKTSDWFLVSSPVPTLAVVALYLLVIYRGPGWMKDRPAFDLKPFIVVYNFFLVLLSLYMVFELVMSSWLAPGFSLSCQTMDHSPDNPYAMRLAAVIWWYYFSKIIELMDTIFFVLRKKNNQISVLHVYHHTSMPLLWWIGTRFVPGGESFFSPTINSFIHILMYSYYMLSAFGPAMQPYLWWKKYITTLQLMQFWLIVVKSCVAIYTNCGFHRAYILALIAYCFSQIILFSNFYYQTYTKKARLLQQRKKYDITNHHNGTKHEVDTSVSSQNGESNGVKLQNGNGHINGIGQAHVRQVKKD